MDEEREILAFPMDLTEYDASEMGLWNGSYTGGVVSIENFLTVKASGGMTVTLSPGLFYLKRDIFRSIAGLVQTALQFTVPTAHTSMMRYDAIGVRYDKNLETVDKLYRQGTPSQKPQLPTISRGTVEADELFIVYLEVPPGATQIQQSYIHDLRLNEHYCGLVKDSVIHIPTQQLYDAWWAWFSALKINAEQHATEFVQWINAFKLTKDEEFSAWFTSRREDVDAWFSSLRASTATKVNGMISEFEKKMADAIASIESLSDEPAFKLQLQINALKSLTVASDEGANDFRLDKKTGQFYVKLAGTWLRVENAVVQLGLTVKEYRALGLTVSAYSALNLTVADYRYKLRTLKGI